MSDLTLRLLLLGSDVTGSAALSGLAKKASSLPTQLAGPLAKMGSMIGGEVGELVTRVSEGFEKIGEGSEGLGKKFAVGGAALAGLGAAGALIGSKDKTSLQQLKTAISDAGGSYEDYAKEIEETVKKQEDFGHSAVSTQNALATLTAATGDPKKAIEDMGVVSDLAAARHMDLGSAADQVAKILNGKGGKTLAMYGIQMDSLKAATSAASSATKQHEAALAGVEHAQRTLSDIEAVDGQHKKLTIGQQIQLRNAQDALRTAQEKLAVSAKLVASSHSRLTEAAKGNTAAVDKLAEKVKGQASASVDSWAGKLDVLRTKIGDQAAVLGQKYGPALTVAGTGITALGTVTEFLRGRQAAAAAATEAETVATEGQSVATKVAAAGQWLLNAALDANPIALVVIAIAALVAGIILAYKHSATFRAIVSDAFKFVKAIVMDVVGWIRSNWPLLLAILTGPIGLAVLMIIRHWTTIKNGALDVRNWIVGRFNDLIGFFTSLPGRLARVTAGLFDGFKTAFRAAINWILSAWDSLRFSVNIPKIHVKGTNMDLGGGSFGFGVPYIPLFAEGGIATRPTLGIFGEAGPEALIPLNRAGGAAGLGHTDVTINLGVLYGDARQAARIIAGELERLSNSGTPLRIKIA